jgi:tetratricopeptide (TPR) repeat protein
MTTRTFRALRVTLATVCSLTLVLPTVAQARVGEPEAAEVSPAEASDDLPPRAQEHVVKGVQQFQNGAYSNAEEEFRRAAFFAPKWRSLHFNLGVVAEAQGKLGVALTEYKAFKPYASPDEAMVADQRILELDSRRRRIAGAYKSQIATSAIAMSLGVVLLGGGGALLGLAIKDKSTISSNTDEIGKLDPTTGAATIDELQTENDKLTARRTKFLYGAYFGILVGIMAVAYSFVPLTKSIKSKRQLEGIALGPTRLQWNGGLGARLRF